jgi:uncharacterized protein (TIGR04255 family)
VPGREETYPHAPVREVVFEVRFPGRLRVESHRFKLQERLETDFPTLKLPVGEPEKPPLFKWYQLESKDTKESVRTGINFISYITQAYQGFSMFRDRALSIIEPSLELFRVSELSRTGLRFVNHIPLAKQEDAIPLGLFLKASLGLPPTIPEPYERMQMAIEAKLSRGRVRVHIEYIPADAGGEETLLLDLDYFIPGPLKVGVLRDCLDESHTHTKAIFESLITDQYRSFIRGAVR